MNARRLVWIVPVVTLSSACADDERAASTTTIDSGRATQVAATFSRGASRATSADGTAALSNLVTASLRAQALVATGVSVSATTPSFTLGSCTCSSGECLLEGCASPANGGRLTGRVSYGPDHLRCEGLRYDLAATGMTTHLTVECDVIVADGRMNGEFRVSGALDFGAVDLGEGASLAPVTWSSSVRLIDVVVTSDAQRGRIQGAAVIDAETSIGTRRYVGHARVSLD